MRTVPWDKMLGTVDQGPFTSVEQALASCSFSVAAILVFGRYDRDLIRKALGHAGVDALAQRVEMIGVRADTTSGPDGRSFEVTVFLTSGAKLVADGSDMPAPMSPAGDLGNDSHQIPPAGDKPGRQSA